MSLCQHIQQVSAIRKVNVIITASVCKQEISVVEPSHVRYRGVHIAARIKRRYIHISFRVDRICKKKKKYNLSLGGCCCVDSVSLTVKPPTSHRLKIGVSSIVMYIVLYPRRSNKNQSAAQEHLIHCRPTDKFRGERSRPFGWAPSYGPTAAGCQCVIHHRTRDVPICRRVHKRNPTKKIEYAAPER